MFSIIHGNRIEALAEKLLADASSNKNSAHRDTDVLRPKTIIVPSLGMARWLKDRTALREGVCANVECPYLGEFIWKSFSALLPDVPARSPFDTEVIAWRVFSASGRCPRCRIRPARGLCNPRQSTGPHGARVPHRAALRPVPRIPARLAACLGKGPAARARQRRRHAARSDSFSAGPALRCGSGPTRTRRSPRHARFFSMAVRCFTVTSQGQTHRTAHVARAHAAVERDAGTVTHLARKIGLGPPVLPQTPAGWALSRPFASWSL